MSSTEEASASFQPAPEIPDYEFPANAKLGEGSFGEVWYGIYKGDQPRAVKVFKPGMMRDDLWRSEYEKLKALDEPPGIVTLYDRGETRDGLPYVAMRLMAEENGDGNWRGRTLMERIGAGDLDPETRWRLVFEIAEVLAFMHRQNVYHCDVKPANVLLSAGDEPRPVLCDFGQSIGDGYTPESATGTFLYASPEQLRREEGSIASWDVYSFGVTAWYLLTGDYPRLSQIAEDMKNQDAATFLQSTLNSLSMNTATMGVSLDRELIPKIMVEAIEREHELTIPAAQKESKFREEFEVVARCLSLKGDQPPRYENMSGVKDAFDAVARNRAVAGERKKKIIFAVLTAFGVVTTLFAGWLWMAAEVARTEAVEFGEQAADSAREQTRLAIEASEKRKEAEKLRLLAEEQSAKAKEQTLIAEKERGKAQESEEAAILGRATAETLINSMLYDLKNELEPLGRVELLDEVSEEAANYFANLPSSQRTESSERERSTMLNNRGEVFLAKGELDRAEEAFDMSLKIRRELLALAPEDANRKRDVSVSIERKGDVLRARGTPEEARQHYLESLKIREELLETDGNQSVARDLSVSLGKVSDILLREESDLEDAEKINLRAIQLLENLSNSDPENRGMQRDLAVLKMRLGDVRLLRGNRELAKSLYEESSDRLESLLSSAPADDLLIRRDYGASLFRLGDWYAESGESAKAVSNLEKARPLLVQLHLQVPGSSDFLLNLALAQSHLGQVYLDNGKPDRAAELLKESVRYFESLLQSTTAEPVLLEEAQLAMIACGDAMADEASDKEVAEMYSRSLAVAEKRSGISGSKNAETQRDLVVSLYKSAMALRKAGGPNDGTTAKSYLNRAVTVLDGMDTEEAEDWLEVIRKELDKL